MKRNKLFWSLLATMMVVLTCGIMTACGSDDDSVDPIIGTWTGIDGQRTLALTFASGNTGTYTSIQEDQEAGTETKTNAFTYTPADATRGVLIMKVYDSHAGVSTEVYYYMIEGNVMRLYRNDYYNDLAWTLSKDGKAPANTTSNAVGTWAGVDGSESLTLIFQSANSGEYIYKYDGSKGQSTDASTFVYASENANKGVLVMKFTTAYSGTSSGIFFYMIDGKTMRLYDQGYYDGLKWTLTKK